MTIVNKLPTEFLQKVSKYLSLQDCYNCLFVCKLWHQIFQATLYKSIWIESNQQLEKFLKSNEYYGHLVKEIHLSNVLDSLEIQDFSIKTKIDIQLDQTTLQQFNLYCPLLEVIEFDISLWKHINLNQLSLPWIRMRSCAPIQYRDFNPTFLFIFGSTLTKLHVHHYEEEMESLIDKIGQINTLKDLTLEILLNEEIVVLPWSHYLERIGENLPKLKKLSLIRDKTPRQELTKINNNFKRFKNNQQSELESLHLHGHIDSIKWFEFITFNYPYLKQLKLTQFSTSRFGTKWMWQNALVNLIQNLSQLKTLNLGGRNIPQLFSESLIKSLNKSTCSIKELFIDYETCQAIESCQFLLLIQTHGLNQLKYLRLRVWEQIPGWSQVTSNLFQCHGLISLHLTLSKGLLDQFPFTPFLIDNFLNNLPQLQTLTLIGANIQVDLQKKNKFKLRKLELFQSKVENHEIVFQYLSISCPNLNQVIFKKCETEKKRINISTLLNTFTLDLRHSHLKKIILSTLLIYIGTIQFNKFIGIRLKYNKEEEEEKEEENIIWCNSVKLMIYPIYFINEDEEENNNLNRLYKSYISSQPLIDNMPGNYTPSVGVITIYCKSVNQIYLDHLKIK